MGTDYRFDNEALYLEQKRKLRAQIAQKKKELAELEIKYQNVCRVDYSNPVQLKG